jgi:hypothetical protein
VELEFSNSLIDSNYDGFTQLELVRHNKNPKDDPPHRNHLGKFLTNCLNIGIKQVPQLIVDPFKNEGFPMSHSQLIAAVGNLGLGFFDSEASQDCHFCFNII